MSDPQRIEGEVRSVRRAGTISIPDHVQDRDVVERLTEGADLVRLVGVRERDASELSLGERASSLVALDNSGDDLGIHLSTPWGTMTEVVEREVVLSAEETGIHEGDYVDLSAFEIDPPETGDPDDERSLWLPSTQSLWDHPGPVDHGDGLARIAHDAERPLGTLEVVEPDPIAGRMDLSPWEGLLGSLNRLAGDLVRPLLSRRSR